MNIWIWFVVMATYVENSEAGMVFNMGTFVVTKKCPGDGGLFTTMEKAKRLADGSLGSLALPIHKGHDVRVSCSGSERINPISMWITTDTTRYSDTMCRMMSASKGRHYLWVTVTAKEGGKVVYRGQIRCGYPESESPSNPKSSASVTLPNFRPAVTSRPNTQIPLTNNKPRIASTKNKPRIVSTTNKQRIPTLISRLAITTPPVKANQPSVATQDEPIVHLSANCPPRSIGAPSLHMTADVPAYAKANCKNGPKILSTTNGVHFKFPATFKQSNPGTNCQFYKKIGTNTFTVDVEVGWGEQDNEIMTSTLTKTLTCAFDDHGNGLTNEGTIADWFLAPKEIQTLRGADSTITFSLRVFDVLNKEITTDYISIGRKIRLVATNSSGAVAGFRALSCNAENNYKSYAILRAGCGDGHVFPKAQGFYTEGNVVYSPYFNAFHLRDGNGLRFECHFTVCTSLCDGSSCPSERRKRSPYRRRPSPSLKKYRKRYQYVNL